MAFSTRFTARGPTTRSALAAQPFSPLFPPLTLSRCSPPSSPFYCIYHCSNGPCGSSRTTWSPRQPGASPATGTRAIATSLRTSSERQKLPRCRTSILLKFRSRFRPPLEPIRLLRLFSLSSPHFAFLRYLPSFVSFVFTFSLPSRASMAALGFTPLPPALLSSRLDANPPCFPLPSSRTRNSLTHSHAHCSYPRSAGLYSSSSFLSLSSFCTLGFSLVGGRGFFSVCRWRCASIPNTPFRNDFRTPSSSLTSLCRGK